MTTLNVVTIVRKAGKKAALPILGLAAGFAAAVATTAAITPTYQATASVIVLPVASNSAAVRLSDVSIAQNLVSSVAQLASSREVAVGAAQELGVPVDQVSGRITGDSQPGIQIVTVHATGETGARAAANANAATRAMITTSSRLHLGGSAVAVEQLDQAGVPATPIAPRRALNYVLGALIGLLLGLACVTLFTRVSNRFERVEDIEADLGLPAFGVIGRRTRRRGGRPAEVLYARTEVGGAVDGLVSALSVMVGKRTGRRIVVTSVSEVDSAAFVAALLAVGLRQPDRVTVLLEAKLSAPVVHRHFGTHELAQVGDVLGRDDQRGPSDGDVGLLNRLGVSSRGGGIGLAVLTLDAVSDYFDAQPSFDQIGALIDTLAAAGSDVVVLAPAVLSGPGLPELTNHADATILVVDSDRARKAAAGRASMLIQRLGVPVVGLVVTGSAGQQDGSRPTFWPVSAPSQRHNGSAQTGRVAGSVDPREQTARMTPERGGPNPHSNG